MITTMKTGKCPRCGNVHQYEPCELLPKIVPICDDCEARQTATWDQRQAAQRWEALYRVRCPEGYAWAKQARIPASLAPALRWDRTTHRGGIGLIGDSGLGKSCALACVVRGLRETFIWLSGTEARDAAIEAATAEKGRDEARRRWVAAMRVPVLVLDDISQGKMTDAWSARLFDLLETRLSGGLPTMWTSQIPLDRLRGKIVAQNGGDSAQADAISRRLGQHSLVLLGS